MSERTEWESGTSFTQVFAVCFYMSFWPLRCCKSIAKMKQTDEIYSISRQVPLLYACAFDSMWLIASRGIAAKYSCLSRNAAKVERTVPNIDLPARYIVYWICDIVGYLFVKRRAIEFWLWLIEVLVSESLANDKVHKLEKRNMNNLQRPRFNLITCIFMKEAK